MITTYTTHDTEQRLGRYMRARSELDEHWLSCLRCRAAIADGSGVLALCRIGRELAVEYVYWLRVYAST